ncbi:MAG: alpha/beta hydrolase [Planctomycetales bacterium]|nr:alpha/beta hydrolase [Planctomycetales bacterium]
MRSLTLGLLCLTLTMSATAAAQDPTQLPEDGSTQLNMNLTQSTLGGKQFWTDQLIYPEWRIQKNVLTSHCRLLDAKNKRQAWGNFDQCYQRLNELAPTDQPRTKGRVVIALHGLIRSRSSMAGMCAYLEEKLDCTTINMSYASTRESVADHAAALKSVIDHLPDAREIDFIAHSLGNIVIRHYLADATDEAQGHRPDPRIRRIVMLGPPNNGSQFAQRFRDNLIFRGIFGKSGQQLAEEWNTLDEHLVIPACEFAIIAGGKQTDSGRNPLLTGDDDFVVTVDETRLPGSQDFEVVPTLHSFLMDDPQVRQHAVSFFKTGKFDR